MQLDFQTGAFLLLIAGVVAMISRRLHLPYSVGLVVAGIVLTAMPFAPKITLTRELIFTALLPPLLFEATLNIDWQHLRRDLPVISMLATVGVVISACVTAVGMHYLAEWKWISAIVFGVLIAATDPVSVIATFREARAKGRLLLLIEAESLLNDGTAAVAFAVVIAVFAGQQVTAMHVIGMLWLMVGGGVLCGGLVGAAALVLAGHTDDRLVEITFTTVAAYGSFLLANHFGFSGVLATITAGLVMGTFRTSWCVSERGWADLQTFWEYAAFVANSLVFLLIGMHLAQQNFRAIWLPVAIAIALVMLGRALAVYPCCALFRGSSLRVAANHQHVLFWGGLRGTMALALALGLPADMPYREQIVVISFAVVAFSVFAQGLTIPWLLRRLKITA
jgi:CPA1 family monovalent cation:H+ antiporter